MSKLFDCDVCGQLPYQCVHLRDRRSVEFYEGTAEFEIVRGAIELRVGRYCLEEVAILTPAQARELGEELERIALCIEAGVAP